MTMRSPGNTGKDIVGKSCPAGTESIALPTLDLGAGRGGWSTQRRCRLTPGKENAWTSRPVWIAAESFAPHRGSNPAVSMPTTPFWPPDIYKDKAVPI
jgi:hypothetical protein